MAAVERCGRLQHGAERKDADEQCYMFSKWSYALDAAATFMMWQRHGDIVDFVNFNNLAK